MAIVKVPSSKNPDLPYTVDTVALTCDCPHYQIRCAPANAQQNPESEWKTCKHIDQAVREEHAHETDRDDRDDLPF